MIADEDRELIRACSRDERAFETLLQLFTERTRAAAGAPHKAYDVDLPSFLEQSADVFVAYDRDLRYVAISKQGADLLGRAQDAVVGRTNAELIGSGAETIEPYVRECFEANRKVFVIHEIPTSEGVKLYDSVYTPVLGEDGRVDRVVGICRDVTADKLRLQQLERTLELQTSLLREISTPLLNIKSGIILIPLIGTIDDRRTRQMTEVLLRGISSFQAHTSIIDVTGVSQVDDRVAGALVSGAKAARLLGARVVLTGISPHIARTMVELGVDLASIDTYSSLQQGFASVLAA